MRFILASSSPRRRQLLADAGIDFEVIPPRTDEIQQAGESATDFARRAARDKAESVLAQLANEDCIVLGADTVVIVDDACLGKPGSSADAVEMLRRLRGRTHQVATGVCLVKRTGDDLQLDSFVEITEVRFGPVSDEQIDEYVATGEPLDKAGAYAIQGGAAEMVVGITGMYSNVVGLPVERVVERLK